ncbi:Alanyl-tRNA editing protein Aarsd1 [Psilocybe cubensis]|uniref:ThrRS/AlaRS common domain-containing protein n=2 Tax=Psilocybe cubensis TaxID=181762 RepID=A0A8H7XZ84_PSICU|nr:Alanyl-tRNA editing protein Aarsd1 [Psilocybe cubensis]KAH9483046.1 Alanyl-tRNA editing protein Aarsd1 [Psilocybe cubensis]
MAATTLLLSPTTPSDYFRIISPTLSVPTDPQISTPVGLLACQRDPLLRTLETTVVTAYVSQPPPPQASAGKKTKKAVLAPDLPNEPLLHVLLHDTVIFPEGGGQPTDTGIIETTADGKAWEVVQAKRHGGHAVHYVKLPTGVDADAGLLAFQPGAKVTVSLGDNGYERRYDHMSMHTSQHLLSALLETRLNLPTLSWSLTSYPSPCYVEVPRGMTQEEIASIQAEANRLVFEGRKVHVEVEELDVAQEQAKPVQKLESGRAVGKGLPEDYTGGVKRVVIIDGVDKNPCCGTHLPTIHNLQLFLVPHTEALARSSTTTARLYFLCGPRLIAHLTSTHTLLASTAAIMSCGPPLVPERVSQVVDERKKAEKRVSDTEQELAEHIARDLATKISTSEGSPFKFHLHRTDDTSNALGFLSSIAFALTAAAEPSRPYVVVLSSSPTTQTASSVSTVLVLGTTDSSVKAAGDGLKSKLGVKGGGKGPRWSGKFTGVWKAGKEDVVVQEVLDSI